MRFDNRLLGVINRCGVGVIAGVVDFHHGFVGQVDFINDARNRRDKVEVIFALQTFLDDFQMQKP